MSKSQQHCWSTKQAVVCWMKSHKGVRPSLPPGEVQRRHHHDKPYLRYLLSLCFNLTLQQPPLGPQNSLCSLACSTGSPFCWDCHQESHCCARLKSVILPDPCSATDSSQILHFWQQKDSQRVSFPRFLCSVFSFTAHTPTARI